MKDLTRITGFEVFLKDDGTLEFGSGVMQVKPQLRMAADLRPVSNAPDLNGQDIAYRMYRGTGMEKDRNSLFNEGLRYDLTVISPGKLGNEYMKTLGHYHPFAPGGVFTYPEVYQVVSGKAHFLMQRGGALNGEVTSFLIADFEEGDILLIPPFYAHATVNPGDDYLVLANFIAKDFSSLYEPIVSRRGMAYYDVHHKGQSLFIPNDSYPSHPKPTLVKPKDYPEFGLKRGESMYLAWKNGADLSFLTNPAKYEGTWLSMGIRPGPEDLLE